MTIPGRGDLSPRRRYRHGRRRWPRVLATVLVLAGLGAAGWFAYNHWISSDDATATVRTQPTPCPSTGDQPLSGATPPPHAPVRVLNGTLRTGLAAEVARALHRQGPTVPIARVGNAAKMMKGASIVRFPAGLRVEGWLVAAAISPPGQPTEQAGVSGVELDLGTSFHRMATASEYRAAFEHFRGQVTPPPSPAPSHCTSSGSP